MECDAQKAFERKIYGFFEFSLVLLVFFFVFDWEAGRGDEEMLDGEF